MTNLYRLFAGIVLAQALSFGQPFIFTRGVKNAASSLPFGVPAGTIAQGSIFSIYGRNLGPASGASASSFPLQNTLSGVSVTVTDGVATLNAIPLYVSASQVNAIMPSNAPTGTVSVRVLVSGSKSNSVPARVGVNSLGLFTAKGSGAGPGIIFNYVSQSNQPLNSLQAPAKPGQVVTLWGTGLGPVAVDNVAPSAGNLPVAVDIFVGGKSTPKMYAGRSPCCSGDDQIVFQVPKDAPTGCWVPVYVKVADAVVSNTVTMAITSDGSACTGKASAVAKSFAQGGKLGLLAPLRVDLNQAAPNSPVDLRSDFLVARLGQEKGGNLAFNPLISLPPADTCTAYSGLGDWFTAANLPNIAPDVKVLSGGGATVSGGGKNATYGTVFSPMTLGALGANDTASSSAKDSTLLAPGSFTVQLAGGADVPSFKQSFTMISPLTWTNQSQVDTITRSSPLTVNWSGGSGLSVAVVGGSVDLPTDSSSIFVCTAAAGASSLTVPVEVLANLPPGRGSAESRGVIFVVGAGSVGAFSASGLNQGFLVPVYASGKAIQIQ